jgi:hypothetical protein
MVGSENSAGAPGKSIPYFDASDIDSVAASFEKKVVKLLRPACAQIGDSAVGVGKCIGPYFGTEFCYSSQRKNCFRVVPNRMRPSYCSLRRRFHLAVDQA